MKTKCEVEGNRWQWVQIAKGIGVILVVIGHFLPLSSPLYWIETRKIIYSFHMPLFFILSGYLYCHKKYSYFDLIKNKINRLVYPFIAIAILFFLFKLAAGKLVNLSLPVDLNSVYALLIDPAHSYMPLLWFVHALFLIFLIYPMMRLFLNNYLILLLSVCINIFVDSDYIFLGNAITNIPFFLVGVIIREHTRLFEVLIRSDWLHALVLLFLFVILYVIAMLFNLHNALGYISKFILGVVGAFFVVNTSRVISASEFWVLKKVLLQIGSCSMTIYLFHTLFESAVRIGFLQGLKQISIPFEITALTAILCGVVFPFVLEKRILRKYWITRRFILGLT